MNTTFKSLGARIGFIAAIGFCATASAEVNHATFGIQNGIAYTPLHVMMEQRLVEKHAARLGLKEFKADFKNLGSPGVIRDALVAGQVNFGAVGVPTLVTMHDKTKGDIKAVGSIVSLPQVLNTTNASAKTICDLGGSDKIAVPTVKSSVQAVTLQMAAKQYCKDAFVLDKLTLSADHPAGMAQLLTGSITAHFTTPPFSKDEVEKGGGKVRPLLNSYDLFGGKATFVLLVASDKWRQENPKAYEAVQGAFEEALAMINKDKKWAAEVYARVEKPKETLADVIKEMESPEIEFTNVPLGIGRYASFLKEVGTVKGAYDWKAMSMPNLRSVKGS